MNKLRFSVKDMIIYSFLLVLPMWYLAGNPLDGDELVKTLTGLAESSAVLALLHYLLPRKDTDETSNNHTDSTNGSTSDPNGESS